MNKKRKKKKLSLLYHPDGLSTSWLQLVSLWWQLVDRQETNLICV
jgi:hypothetical protein